MARVQRVRTEADRLQTAVPETHERPRALAPGEIPHGAIDSPAMRLQQRVADAYARGEARWSARRTLAFIIVTCGGFWALVWMGLSALAQ